MRPAAGLARGGTSRYRIVSYRIEKKTLISYRYRIESKKSLSLLTDCDTSDFVQNGFVWLVLKKA